MSAEGLQRNSFYSPLFKVSSPFLRALHAKDLFSNLPINTVEERKKIYTKTEELIKAAEKNRYK